MPHTTIESFEPRDAVSTVGLLAKIPNEVRSKILAAERPAKDILVNLIAFARDYYELYGEKVNHSSLQRS